MRRLAEVTTRQTYPTRRQSRKIPSLHGNWYDARSNATTADTSASVMGRITTSGADCSSSGEVAIGTYTARQLSEHAARKLQVFPGLPLVCGRAQQIGRMIRHYERSIQLAEVVHLAAQPAQGQVGAQQVLGRNPSNRQHEPGLQERDLAHQVRQAGGHLLRLRVPVVRRTALEHVGDVDVGPPIEAYGAQHRIQQVPGA